MVLGLGLEAQVLGPDLDVLRQLTLSTGPTYFQRVIHIPSSY